MLPTPAESTSRAPFSEPQPVHQEPEVAASPSYEVQPLVTQAPTSTLPVSHTDTMQEVKPSPSTPPRRSSRQRRRPVYLQDFQTDYCP